MRAEIVSVGTELLLGEIVDTNAAYLARQLAALGIDLYWTSVVGDNKARIVDLLRRARERTDMVVITGGLGPTDDDLTRESIAELLGEEMVVTPALEKTLRDFFSGRGIAMPERNVKQATLIPSSQALLNPIGTAPGWWVEHDGKIIVAMPGVPVEMYRMWEREVTPKLRSRQGASVLLTRRLKVIGMGESAVEDAIRELVAVANPSVATYAKQDGVHVRIAAKAKNKEESQRLIDATEARVRSILGSYVYGTDDETLAGAVGRLLRESKSALAVAEISTGGWLANVFTEEPRKEDFFKGGLVIPTLEILPFPVTNPALLARNGNASAALGEAIAEGVRAHFGADIGLASMPVQLGDGEAESLMISLSDQGTGSSHRVTLRRSSTSELKRMACLGALSFLRRHLLHIS